MGRKQTAAPPSDVDSNLRKNLIVDNVQRTTDVNVASEMRTLRPTSPLMNSVNHTGWRSLTPASRDAEMQALTQPRIPTEVCKHAYHKWRMFWDTRSSSFLHLCLLISYSTYKRFPRDKTTNNVKPQK